MFKLTLTPNRSNPPQFAALTCYERRGDKVTRLLKRYNRGAVTGTKVIPFDKNKDWSRVQGERYTMVPAPPASEGGNHRACDYTAEDYANGVPLPSVPRTTRDTPRVKVWGIAKRDWLVAKGYITLVPYPMTRDMEWVPGDSVWADSIHADTGREVDCYEDIDEDAEDCAITGGHFKVKE